MAPTQDKREEAKKPYKQLTLFNTFRQLGQAVIGGGRKPTAQQQKGTVEDPAALTASQTRQADYKGASAAVVTSGRGEGVSSPLTRSRAKAENTTSPPPPPTGAGARTTSPGSTGGGRSTRRRAASQQDPAAPAGTAADAAQPATVAAVNIDAKSTTPGLGSGRRKQARRLPALGAASSRARLWGGGSGEEEGDGSDAANADDEQSDEQQVNGGGSEGPVESQLQKEEEGEAAEEAPASTAKRGGRKSAAKLSGGKAAPAANGVVNGGVKKAAGGAKKTGTTAAKAKGASRGKNQASKALEVKEAEAEAAAGEEEEEEEGAGKQSSEPGGPSIGARRKIKGLPTTGTDTSALHVAASGDLPTDSSAMTDYELHRQELIARNKARLEQLALKQAGEAVAAVSGATKRARADASQRGISAKRTKPAEEAAPRRESARIRQKGADPVLAAGVAHESYRGIVLSAHTRERSIWGLGGGAGGTGAASSGLEEVEEEVKPRHPTGPLPFRSENETEGSDAAFLRWLQAAMGLPIKPPTLPISAPAEPAEVPAQQDPGINVGTEGHAQQQGAGDAQPGTGGTSAAQEQQQQEPLQHATSMEVESPRFKTAAAIPDPEVVTAAAADDDAVDAQGPVPPAPIATAAAAAEAAAAEAQAAVEITSKPTLGSSGDNGAEVKHQQTPGRRRSARRASLETVTATAAQAAEGTRTAAKTEAAPAAAASEEPTTEPHVGPIVVVSSTPGAREGAVTSKSAKSLGLKQRDVAKLTKDGVTHLAFHPTCNDLLVAAGDKQGKVSLWQVDYQPLEGAAEDCDGVFMFGHAHHDYISGLRWVSQGGSPGTATQLLTASYDGSLRLLDVGTGTWQDLSAGIPEDMEISSLEVDDGGFTAYLGDPLGNLELIDTRAGKPLRLGVNLHDKRINTLSLDPGSGRLLMTASSDTRVCVWDVRALRDSVSNSRGKPVDSVGHPKSCQSAYWAPDGSQRAVSTSFDDTVTLWTPQGEGMLGGVGGSPAGKGGRSHAASSTLGLHKAIRHDNQTGRWVIPLRAVWSHTADAVLVGNMKRGLDVFDTATGQLVTVLASEFCTAIPSRVVAHPRLHAIAAATSSGRMHIWR